MKRIMTLICWLRGHDWWEAEEDWYCHNDACRHQALIDVSERCRGSLVPAAGQVRQV
jgi:hypothetical protein